ncbi:MAG: hypothetical protein ACQEUT_14835 [Bacillota bacterium]
MDYYKKFLFLVCLFVLLAGCQDKTYQLSDVIEDSDAEYALLLLAEYGEMLPSETASRQSDPRHIEQFIHFTSNAEVKEISSKEAKEVYDEIYQEEQKGDKKILTASVAADEEMSQSFFIYMLEDGRIFASQFEKSVGKKHYVNVSSSTALYDAALEYYEVNFTSDEDVQVLDLMEEN